MRMPLLGLLVVAACSGGSGFDDDYPIRGGGGGGTGSGNHPPDAALLDGPTGTVDGHVCVISDLRRWTAGCATTGLTGLAVTIGTVSAVTDDGGNFTIMPPTPLPATARITGVDIVTSYYPLAAGPTISLVAADQSAFNDLQVGTGIDVAAGDGTLLIELLRDGNRTAGMTADTNPPPGVLANSTVYYDDGADQTLWDDVDTALDSKALAADLPVGPVSMTATIGIDSDSATFDVHADAITFGTVNVIP